MAEQDKAGRAPQAQSMDSAMGAGDASSGGGAGAGIPDADTAERAGDAVTRGEVEQDRKKIFPERPSDEKPADRSRQR